MRQLTKPATAIASLLFLLGGSCGGKTGTEAKNPDDSNKTTKNTNTNTSTPDKGVPLAKVGLSESALDRSADPCNDFYQYACGGWLKKTTIPADQSRWGRFSEIQKRNQTELKRLLEKDAKDGGKAGKYYASCMDEASIEKNGDAALKPYLKEASSVRSKRDLARVFGKLHAYGFNILFHEDVDSDFKNPKMNIAFFYQGGLGLPDRDYYLSKEARQKKIRTEYLAHVQRVFQLIGKKPAAAKKAAAAVMKLETAIAKLHKTRVQMRDPKGLYNPVGIRGLSRMSRTFNWKTYLKYLGHPKIKQISITTPKLFKSFDELITGHRLAAWKAYLQWHVLDAMAMSLSKKFVDESFKMAQAFTGQKELKPRWKRCIGATTSGVRDEVSKLFIRTMFPGESKTAAEGLVHAISNAFAADVGTLDWMSDKTKKKALEKRQMMAYLIGYPDKWRNYNFPIDAQNYVANVLAARKAKQNFELNKVGKPMDRNEWQMSAATVNAYYHPLKNHMVFPAAILQRPFYDVKASDAVNLGAMGMIVGHELTHGFDDSGSQFSGAGKLENWWQPSDAKNFNGKKQCVIDKYNNYEVLPGVHVNGKLTLGENIADTGGVKLAYMAYKKRRAGKTPVVAGGFTEDQQFFLAIGQAWCNKSREARARMLIKVDPHSPPRFRVRGAVSSMPEFARAFSCKKGTVMNPKKRCTVW